MSISQATNQSKETQKTIEASQKRLQNSHEETQAEQKPQAQEPTYKEREEAEKKATKERRASIATHQAFKKKEKAAERLKAARREAERQDQVLQKRLIDQYGYGHHVSSSAVDDPKAIEMRQINGHPNTLGKYSDWDSEIDRSKKDTDTKEDDPVAQKLEDAHSVDDHP